MAEPSVRSEKGMLHMTCVQDKRPASVAVILQQEQTAKLLKQPLRQLNCNLLTLVLGSCDQAEAMSLRCFQGFKVCNCHIRPSSD